MQVELKKPSLYEDVVDVAKRKEWKLTMMSQMGMIDSLPLAVEIRKVEPIVQRPLVEVLRPIIQALVQPLAPAMIAAIAIDDGLRQEMRQVVDLMKDLGLNILSNSRNVQGHGEDQKINFAMMVGKKLAGGGGICLLVTIAVKLVTSALYVISL